MSCVISRLPRLYRRIGATHSIRATRLLTTSTGESETGIETPPADEASEAGAVTTTHSQSEDHEDEELVQLAQASQDAEISQNLAPPYKSSFPLSSEILRKREQSQFRLNRNQFLRQLLSGSDPKKSTGDGEVDPNKRAIPDGPDQDQGYAELGETSKDEVALLIDDQNLTLHPSRFFYPGESYEPEELHPLGIPRNIRTRRRARTARVIYPEPIAKKKIDFKNLAFLNNYLSDSGLILPRKETRLPQQLHKRMERSVKLAQSLALLPVLDRRAEFKRRPRRRQEVDILT